MKYEFDNVAIRMVKEPPLLADEPVNTPAKAVDVLYDLLHDFDREMMIVVNLKTDMTPINMNIVSMGTINASLAASRELLKTSILSKLRTQRTIGESVLYSYLNARELGLEEPLEKQLFEKVGGMTMDDLKATHERWIKDRTYVYAILGDTRDLDMQFLRSLGPVRTLTLEEIFGY